MFQFQHPPTATILLSSSFVFPQRYDSTNTHFFWLTKEQQQPFSPFRFSLIRLFWVLSHFLFSGVFFPWWVGFGFELGLLLLLHCCFLIELIFVVLDNVERGNAVEIMKEFMGFDSLVMEILHLWNFIQCK